MSSRGALLFVWAHGDRDSLLFAQTAPPVRLAQSGCVRRAARRTAWVRRFRSLRFDTVVNGIDAFAAWVGSREQARKV